MKFHLVAIALTTVATCVAPVCESASAAASKPLADCWGIIWNASGEIDAIRPARSPVRLELSTEMFQEKTIVESNDYRLAAKGSVNSNQEIVIDFISKRTGYRIGFAAGSNAVRGALDLANHSLYANCRLVPPPPTPTPSPTPAPTPVATPTPPTDPRIRE